MQVCRKAQEQLTKAQAESRKWERARKEALTTAFAAGTTAQELADALGVSRTKIYQLISSADAVQD